MRTYLEEVDTQHLVASKNTANGKATLLEDIINTGMDILLPVKTRRVYTNEPPWMNDQLKSLINQRQQALAKGDTVSFRILRNRVNRERKACRAKYFASNVEHLRNSKPNVWWTEVKKLSGMTTPTTDDVTSSLKHVINELRDHDGNEPSLASLANTINDAFLAPMNIFIPLPTVYTAPQPSSISLNVSCVFNQLASINASKSPGPDGIPGWVLKENADLLAPVVVDVLSASFNEKRLPKSWKRANVVPVPKQKPVVDINKHLRPISLTPILSKLAEEQVVEQFIKPAVLKCIDPQQFGTRPASSTTQALISMLHSWYRSTDGNSATCRVLLFDFTKAFDLIDHHLLVRKLRSFDIPDDVIAWVIDFLIDRKQRVKLGPDCFSEWKTVPAGVPQGTKLGPWLFVIMINDLSIEGIETWKYVDDATVSETK